MRKKKAKRKKEHYRKCDALSIERLNGGMDRFFGAKKVKPVKGEKRQHPFKAW
jgi:hypothetical protein